MVRIGEDVKKLLEDISSRIEKTTIEETNFVVYRYKCPFCRRYILGISPSQALHNIKAHLVFKHYKRLSKKPETSKT